MGSALQRRFTLQANGPAGAFVLTDDEVQALSGGSKTFPVRVTVGSVSVAVRLTRMGGENLIGLAKAARQQLGVDIGDEVDVTVELDDAPRTVEVPDDLAAALAADPSAAATFEGLAPSHRKEYVRWVTEAKQAATRERRIAGAVERLRDGQCTPR